MLVIADTVPWGADHLNFLSPLTALQMLDLARTYVSAPSLEVLGKLHSLRQLDLSHTGLDNSMMITISPALTGLQRLDVSYTPVVRHSPFAFLTGFSILTSLLHT